MRQVTAVLFEEWDKRELALAERHVGIHPHADLISGRKRKGPGVETNRERVLALIHSITESNEPVFAERLLMLREALVLMIETAWEQMQPDYWTSSGCTIEQALVLTGARDEAYKDCLRARKVVDDALPWADAVRPYVEDEQQGGL